MMEREGKLGELEGRAETLQQGSEQFQVIIIFMMMMMMMMMMNRRRCKSFLVLVLFMIRVNLCIHSDIRLMLT